jgi:hypothetical protein
MIKIEEKIADVVWEQMVIDIDKEMMGTFAKDSCKQTTLTFSNIEEIIDNIQAIMEKDNFIHEIARRNGFNLFKGDIAIISFRTAEKLGMKHNTKEIKISPYIEDDQIYFLKGSVIDIFA